MAAHIETMKLVFLQQVLIGYVERVFDNYQIATDLRVNQPDLVEQCYRLYIPQVVGGSTNKIAAIKHLRTKVQGTHKISVPLIPQHYAGKDKLESAIWACTDQSPESDSYRMFNYHCSFGLKEAKDFIDYMQQVMES